MRGGRHGPQTIDQTKEPELTEDIGQALPGRRQADPQEPVDPVPRWTQGGPGQAQAGAAPDQEPEHEAAPDSLSAGRADGDPGEPERTDRPPTHGQEPGQANIDQVHEDHHLHSGAGVSGASEAGVAHRGTGQERDHGADDPEKAGRGFRGEPGEVHRDHDPGCEDLYQHQRDDPQAKAHCEGLAAEPGCLIGPPRAHRPGNQGRSTDRADTQKGSEKPEQVAGHRHAGEVLGCKIPAGDDRIRQADQVEQRLLDEHGSCQPENLPADR